MYKGITIIEALVAVLILAISVTAGMQLYVTNLQTTSTQDEYYAAENLLREHLEKLKNKPELISKENTDWDLMLDKKRLKYNKNINLVLATGRNVPCSIYIDTAICRIDATNYKTARLRSVKAEVTWGEREQKKLSAATMIEGDYPRPPVGNN